MVNPFPRIQRVLLLQGGGALGAYQAGALKALYEKIINDKDRNGDNDNAPLFDIIAGTIYRGHKRGNSCSAISLRTKPGMAQQKGWKKFGSIYQRLPRKYRKH